MRTLGSVLVVVIATVLAPSLATAQEWEEVALYGGWLNDSFADSMNRVWAATSRGGVYRLANENAAWVRVFDDPDIDPRSVAVGTGGRAYIGTDGFNNTGFFRTTNDGVSWQMINTSVSDEIVRDILPMPDNQTLWACTFDDGLHRSTNGGTNFARVTSFPVSFPTFVRANAAGHLFVGVQLSAVNLYFSSDGGVSWQARDTGFSTDVNSLCVDPTTGHLYAADGANVYKSTNDGLAWTSLAAPPGAYLDVAVFQGRLYAGQYNGSATGAQVYSTDIDAANFRANWVGEGGVPSQPFSGFLVTPEWMYLGGQGPGTYRRNAEGWSQWTEGMRNLFINVIVADESNGMVHVAAQNAGIFSSTNGIDWTRTGNGIPPTEFIYSIVSVPNGDLYASGASTGIYKSSDGGANYTNVFPVSATALGVNDWGYVFAGYGSRIYRTMDAGATWPQVAMLPGVNGISDIECTGSNVYVGTGFFDFGAKGVFLSSDWGNSFSAFNTGLGSLVVRDIGIDPDEGEGPCEITAATSAGLYDLNGVTWSLNVSYGLGNVERVYKSLGRRVALEETRLRYSSPQTCIWNDWNEPDPMRYYGEFGGFRLASNALRGDATYVDLLGTVADGLYRMGGAPTTGAADAPPSSTGLRFDVRRNPFVGSATLEFEMPHAGPATISIFDAAGRKVTSLVDGWTAAGRHAVDWNADGLASGVYFARLAAGESARTQRLVLLR